MSILDAIMVGIGVVIGVIILVVLLAFLIELVKAFSQLGEKKDGRGEVNNGSHRDD